MIYKYIDNFFKISERNTLIKKEIIGGITTFLAMIYILSVNPSILSLADGQGGKRGFLAAIFLGTAISSFLATFLMGVFANVPLVLAPGMGINAFFTFNVANALGIGYGGALLAVFISGNLYFLIAVTNLRKYLVNSVSKNLKISISVLIGLLIGYIGLQNMGVIVSNPATLTGLGDFKNPMVIIGILVFLIMIVLYLLKIQGAVIISMIAGVIMLAITYGISKNWTLDDSSPLKGTIEGLRETFQLRTFSDFTKFSEASKEMWTSASKAFSNPLFYWSIFTFLYVDFFDTTGTLMVFDSMISKEHYYNEEFRTKWIKRANIIDGTSTIFGSLLLNSSVTTYVESAVAIKSGAKTGISSLTTSFLFLISIALWPILGPLLPIKTGPFSSIQPITGPVFIFISILILKELRHFEWKKTYDVVVLLITVLIGVLGFSISVGISFGFASYLLTYGLVDTIKYLIKRKEYQGKNIKYLDFMKNGLNLTVLAIAIISITYIILNIFYH